METIVSLFVAVWTAVSGFLVQLFPDIIALFYAEGALTFVGVMAVIMAGVSLILLIFNLIRSFFSMRG